MRERRCRSTFKRNSLGLSLLNAFKKKKSNDEAQEEKDNDEAHSGLL